MYLTIIYDLGFFQGSRLSLQYSSSIFLLLLLFLEVYYFSYPDLFYNLSFPFSVLTLRFSSLRVSHLNHASHGGGAGGAGAGPGHLLLHPRQEHLQTGVHKGVQTYLRERLEDLQ